MSDHSEKRISQSGSELSKEQPTTEQVTVVWARKTKAKTTQEDSKEFRDNGQKEETRKTRKHIESRRERMEDEGNLERGKMEKDN